MRGSIVDCAISTRRLVATKTIASARMVPCSSGRSRWKIAELSSRPVPGQENTVSMRIEPRAGSQRCRRLVQFQVLLFSPTPQPVGKFRKATLIEGDGERRSRRARRRGPLPRPGLRRQEALRRELQQARPTSFAHRRRQGHRGLGQGARRRHRRQPDRDRDPAGPRLRRGRQRTGRHQGHRHAVLRRRHPGRRLSGRWLTRQLTGPTSRPRKSERLLNLLIMLLVQRHYVPKDRIRAILYADSSADGLREDVRARQGGAAQPRRADRGRPDGRLLRRRARLPDPPRRASRCPTSRSTPDEAAVIGLATRVWQHARLAEATTEAVRKLTAAGVRGRRVGARHRRAPPERRRAVLRRVLGGHPGAHARSSSTTAPRRPTPRHPAPAAVGRRPLLRALVRRRASTPTAARSGSSGSPGCRARPRKAAQPGSYEVPAGTDVGDDRPAPAPRPDRPSAAVLWSAAAPASRCGARRRLGRDRRRRAPTSRTGWDRVVVTRGGPGLADEVLGYGADVVVEEPADAARRSVVEPTARGAVADRDGRERAPARRAPRTRSPGCSRWCRSCTPGAQVRLEDAAARARGDRPSSCVSDLKVLLMCGLPGRLPRRPHRRRPRRAGGAGGRRRHPGVQRRLPRPAAAADPDRGDRGHRRAARPAQRRPGRDPRGRRPGAGQARGGRGRRLGRRPGRPRRRGRRAPTSALPGHAGSRTRPTGTARCG